MILDNGQLAIKAFCKKIGSNSLLVQGAGGNISWKEDDVLWIKASGMWLIDAVKENIFVPNINNVYVFLNHLHQVVNQHMNLINGAILILKARIIVIHIF